LKQVFLVATEALLKEAAEKEQMLFFEHDAYAECCTVTPINGNYCVKEKVELSNKLINANIIGI